jgi:hypothetical protein
MMKAPNEGNSISHVTAAGRRMSSIVIEKKPNEKNNEWEVEIFKQ